eukprot:COSAG01_NODE_5834_length_4006_cov_2.108267_2_plen_181_part_00
MLCCFAAPAGDGRGGAIGGGAAAASSYVVWRHIMQREDRKHNEKPLVQNHSVSVQSERERRWRCVRFGQLITLVCTPCLRRRDSWQHSPARAASGSSWSRMGHSHRALAGCAQPRLQSAAARSPHVAGVYMSKEGKSTTLLLTAPPVCLFAAVCLLCAGSLGPAGPSGRHGEARLHPNVL